jgi:hypothetical protein
MQTNFSRFSSKRASWYGDFLRKYNRKLKLNRALMNVNLLINFHELKLFFERQIHMIKTDWKPNNLIWIMVFYSVFNHENSIRIRFYIYIYFSSRAKNDALPCPDRAIRAGLKLKLRPYPDQGRAGHQGSPALWRSLVHKHMKYLTSK